MKEESFGGRIGTEGLEHPEGQAGILDPANPEWACPLVNQSSHCELEFTHGA